MSDLAGQINQVQQILRLQRQPVRLVAVTKNVPLGRIEEALALGLTTFAESRVQEALPKLAQLPQAEWHFIGRLQTNKVKDVVGKFTLIHSLDRWKLAEALQREAVRKSAQVQALVQVNIGYEEQKGGLDPREVPEFVQEIAALSHLQVEGLMAVPPQSADPEETRPYFRRMFQLFRQLKDTGANMKTLSMGMSHDFMVAMAEGANLIRLGSILFGERA